LLLKMERPMQKLKRLYPLGLSAVIGVAVAVVARCVLERTQSPLLRTIALLAWVATGTLVVVSLIRFVAGMDELFRKLAYESLGLAFVATFVLSFGYGAFEAWAAFPRLPLLFLPIAMLITWLAALVVSSVRYE
jgi:hypothetical protein